MQYVLPTRGSHPILLHVGGRLALVSAKERADLVEAALGAAFTSAVNVPRNAPIGPRLDAAKVRAICRAVAHACV